MTWAREEPDAPLHPKSFRAGVAAYGFDRAGIAYCARCLTDGFIPSSDLELLFPGTPRTTCRRLAERLVAVRRWTVVEGGWRVHDYLKYNPSREEVVQERAEHHVRSVAGGQSRSRTAQRISGRFSGRMTEESTSHNTSQPPGTLTSQPAGNCLVEPHQPLTRPVPVSSRTRTIEESNYVGQVEPTTLNLDPPPDPSHNGDDPGAARRILTFLNDKTSRHFRPVATNLKFIVARLRDGHTEQQLKAIITRKVVKWQGDPKLDEYLRPATLFNRTKCEQYRGELP